MAEKEKSKPDKAAKGAKDKKKGKASKAATAAPKPRPADYKPRMKSLYEAKVCGRLA